MFPLLSIFEWSNTLVLVLAVILLIYLPSRTLYRFLKKYVSDKDVLLLITILLGIFMVTPLVGIASYLILIPVTWFTYMIFVISLVWLFLPSSASKRVPLLTPSETNL